MKSLFFWCLNGIALPSQKIEALGITSGSAVSNFTSNFKKSGIDIHHVPKMPEQELLTLLFPELKRQDKRSNKPHPDWNYIHTELSRKEMTVTRGVWNYSRERLIYVT
jgi:hypothetical protein